jgi:hypothetical protein
MRLRRAERTGGRLDRRRRACSRLDKCRRAGDGRTVKHPRYIRGICNTVPYLQMADPRRQLR